MSTADFYKKMFMKSPIKSGVYWRKCLDMILQLQYTLRWSLYRMPGMFVCLIAPGPSVPGNLHVPCYVEEWVVLLAACLAAGWGIKHWVVNRIGWKCGQHRVWLLASHWSAPHNTGFWLAADVSCWAQTGKTDWRSITGNFLQLLNPAQKLQLHNVLRKKYTERDK